MLSHSLSRTILYGALALGAALPASATDRRFTYTYETTTAPKGTVELENWVTWRHTNVTGGDDSDIFQFRHELEFGLTDNVQLGVYLADWQYDDHDSEGHKARYQGSGAELIYSHTNPTTDFLGSALYGEVIVGEDSLELEGKVLLQKNFGALRVAYNAIIEAEWEGGDLGDFEESNGEFAQAVGISYDLNKSFSFGAEVLHEVALPEWRDTGDSVVFAGPNVSVRFGRVYVTATALFQLTDVEDEPDAQVRLITGFHF
jgi:hypothetical protein